MRPPVPADAAYFGETTVVCLPDGENYRDSNHMCVGTATAAASTNMTGTCIILSYSYV